MLQSSFYQQAQKLINERNEDSSQKDLELFLRKKFRNEPNSIQQRIINEFFYYGPLHSLIPNPDVSEIIINGHDKIIYEENGQFVKHNDGFYSARTFENFIHKLNFETATQIDLSTPHLNTNWKDFRVHIIRNPVSHPICVTLRRQSMDNWNFTNLVKAGWAPQREVDYILQQMTNRKNILVIGSTGTGKTTILNCCLQSLHPLDRCIVIEDTSELICPNVSSTKLLTRTEHSGELKTYNQADLLKQSLRMRPNRIVVGEIRGAEAMDYLMALSTGHEGGLCSLHANNPRQALIRLEMLIQLGAPQWNLQAIRQLIQLSLDCIITVQQKKGKRVLHSIDQINSLETNGIILDNIYSQDKSSGGLHLLSGHS